MFCIVCLDLTFPGNKYSFHKARILFVITGIPMPIPSTRNHLFLLYSVFIRARIMVDIAGLPVITPSTMNHHFLRQISLNRARNMLDIACRPLTIPFTRNPFSLWHMLVFDGLPLTGSSIRNHLFLNQHIFNRAMLCWVLLASFLQFHPTGIISVLSMMP